MLERIAKLFARRKTTPAELREEEESRRRAEMEWRQAEQRKSETQRGLEGVEQRGPTGPGY